MPNRHKTACRQLKLGNETIELCYFITSKTINDGTLYGVSVEKTDAHGHITTDTVDDITYSHDEIQTVAAKLTAGLVTPVSLRYILEDMVMDTILSRRCAEPIFG
jgi:hypothetical protein